MANPKDRAAMAVNAIHRTIFNLTDGRVGGRVAGMPVVLLTTTGRKSGQPRQTMLTSPLTEGESVVLIASYGDDSRHPAWYRNLEANPECAIVMSGGRRRMRARTASPEEKERLWPAVVSVYKGYADYQRRTERDIPVVILDPA